MEKIKAWAKKLKRQIFVLYLAYKDERVPWYAKLFIVCVVAYAFSPIDFIPDFIPILGYLDEVILLPIGIFFALKMVPNEVIAAYEMEANRMIKNRKPKNWLAGIIIVIIWGFLFLWMMNEVYQFLNNRQIHLF